MRLIKEQGWQQLSFCQVQRAERSGLSLRENVELALTTLVDAVIVRWVSMSSRPKGARHSGSTPWTPTARGEALISTTERPDPSRPVMHMPDKTNRADKNGTYSAEEPARRIA